MRRTQPVFKGKLTQTTSNRRLLVVRLHKPTAALHAYLGLPPGACAHSKRDIPTKKQVVIAMFSTEEFLFPYFVTGERISCDGWEVIVRQAKACFTRPCTTRSQRRVLSPPPGSCEAIWIYLISTHYST